VESTPLAVFRHPPFLLFQAARLLMTLGSQMLTVAVGWQVYALTHQPIHLGYVGLAEFIPNLAFSLISGTVADRFNRRRIVQVCVLGSFLCAGLLLWQSRGAAHPLRIIYAVSVLLGVTRAFSAPASQSIMPALIPRGIFGSAMGVHLVIFQLGAAVGPALGGFVFGDAHADRVYRWAGALYAGAFACLLAVRYRPGPPQRSESTWTSLVAGLRYVWQEKVILGAISLDLFAVLLGGATALLPAFAQTILNRGPVGLGILRAAPAVGSSAAALALTLRPINRRLGQILLGGVAIFGLATIVFGASKSFPLSVVSLVLVGASDMVSVAIRHTLIQLSTPDRMRGRVSAVSFVFIGASNELGEFESGLTAEWWGLAPSVIYGGVGTCLVVLLWFFLFPALRRADRPEPEPDSTPAEPVP
jgi:MFS family permease